MNTLTDTLRDEVNEVGPLLDNTDPERARNALLKPRKTARDFAVLLSPGADTLLEEMATDAHRLTRERFGKTMQLYAPLYLSNLCVGHCPYCGFSKDRDIPRRALKLDEIVKEAVLLKEAGMRSILLVAGDDPKNVDVTALAEVVAAVHRVVPSVSLEVAPLNAEGYRTLAEAGADGVTLYQETYNRSLYKTLHDRGPKRDFDFRLDALSRAGEANFCKLNVGVLWGLSHWRIDALSLGLHARYLENVYWRSHISIGLPRLKAAPEGFTIPEPLDDRSFVHIIAALRLFLPDAGLVLSTREPPALRRHLMHLGITQMSAGSCTQPGGYGEKTDAGEQFEVSDNRSPMAVAADLEASGFEPVWKNWDTVFTTGDAK